jgi:hypothetical protein
MPCHAIPNLMHHPSRYGTNKGPSGTKSKGLNYGYMKERSRTSVFGSARKARSTSKDETRNSAESRRGRRLGLPKADKCRRKGHDTNTIAEAQGQRGAPETLAERACEQPVRMRRCVVVCRSKKKFVNGCGAEGKKATRLMISQLPERDKSIVS